MFILNSSAFVAHQIQISFYFSNLNNLHVFLQPFQNQSVSCFVEHYDIDFKHFETSKNFYYFENADNSVKNSK